MVKPRSACFVKVTGLVAYAGLTEDRNVGPARRIELSIKTADELRTNFLFRELSGKFMKGICRLSHLWFGTGKGHTIAAKYRSNNCRFDNHMTCFDSQDSNTIPFGKK